MRGTRIVAGTAFAAAFGAGLPAAAVDGVLEINQTCAENLGCFSGDSAGFPVEITSPGSYRLTGNLSPSAGPVDVIEIGADDVTLDLNGYGLLGGTVCSETGALPNVVSCTPGGDADDGITVLAPGHERLEVRNGLIQGMQSFGIEASGGDAVVVRDVRLMHNGAGGAIVFRGRILDTVASLNGGAGITVGADSAILRSEARANDGNGIQGDEGIEVLDCRVSANVGTGIFATTSVTGGGSVVDRNRAIGNGSEGIDVAQNSVVTRNVVHQSQGLGIVAATGSVIDGNTVTESQGDGILCANACTVTRNSSSSNQAGGNGIATGDGCTVIGNTAKDNDGDGDGLSLGADTGYDQNVTSGNAGADVGGSGTSLGQNLCSGSVC